LELRQGREQALSFGVSEIANIHLLREHALYYLQEMPVTNQLGLVNDLVANGRAEFTFRDAVEALGASPTSTANALHRLTESGLIDRVTRGHYSVRPLGSLGTSTVTDNLALAIGAALAGLAHRIAYRSALSELGLLTHPVRTVFVACTRQVRFSTISRWPLRVVIERLQTIHLSADRVEHSWRSTLDRALLECAMRVDLAGGVGVLAEALATGSREANPDHIRQLAIAFGPRGFAAERRLASLAKALELPLTLNPRPRAYHRRIRLDPRDEQTVWIDEAFSVAWNIPVDELRAVIEN
jgi:predicted transcriptional regulator of viral defense system